MRRACVWAVAALVVLVGALAVACGGSPDDAVEADEFFRPAVATGQAQGAEEPPGEPQAQSGPADAEPAAPAPQTTEEPEDELDLADDIVRRYLNEAYGYSLELVCGPFCNVATNAIDRVGFLSDTNGAIVSVEVIDAEAAGLSADLEGLERRWSESRSRNQSFEVVERQETSLVLDGSPALRVLWEQDLRPVGGFLARYHTLITQVGPIAYFIDAGAREEEFADIEPYLLRALDSFVALPAPPGRPGVFSKWEFAFPYRMGSFTGEVGQLSPVATYDSGVFVQQNESGALELLLLWDSVGEALFFPDDVLTEALTPAGGAEVEELARGDVVIGEGLSARYALAEARDAAGSVQRRAVYAWYCPDSGRSFVLQSFSPQDAQAQAQASLAGFRCAAP